MVYWFNGLLVLWFNGLMVYWFNGSLDFHMGKPLGLMVYWFNGPLVSGSNPTCFETALMCRNTYMHNPLSGISTPSLNSTKYIM